MVETKREKISLVLQKLKTSGDIEGAAVITRDGLVIASDMSSDIDADTLAAMSATMTGAAETVIQELKKSSPERVIVESKNTKLITIGAGSNAILVCVVKSNAKLGIVLLDMKKASSNISEQVK